MIGLSISLMSRRAGWLAVAAACCCSFGCGQADNSPMITGTVTVDGKPVSGLYVVFYDAATKAATSSTCTQDGGRFEWNVPEPGEYVITAFWPKRIETAEEVIEGPDQLRGRYRQFEHPAAKVTIDAGENALPPIELARK